MILFEPIFRNYASKQRKIFENIPIEMQRMLIEDLLHKNGIICNFKNSFYDANKKWKG